ncbi:MAG: flagellar biosynthesis protein FlhB [Gammaproteobacteria bacterium]|nr:flagellar biosynthesis protein FlhB [Gammaproteobacteria bacterium]
MAEADRDQRTEEPSQRRLQEARERGQVPRSRELATFAATFGGAAALVAGGATLAARLAGGLRTGLAIDPRALADPDSMQAALGAAAHRAVLALLPMFAALTVLILLAGVALGGWNFSPQAFAPNFSRLSPREGLRRVFGLEGLTEAAKALLKSVVVGAVCVGVASHLLTDVMHLGDSTAFAAITHAARLLGWALLWLSAALAPVAILDVPLQLFQFRRSLRMTRQELRDEAKETEGRPETRQRIRQMQQQVARRRMMQKVPTADVVIVNPTHFSVALKYDPQRMRAPRVVAKGVDHVALAIRRIAEEHRVPVFEAPKLARALHRSTDLDHEIPPGLYVAVAQVLSYIFRLRTLPPTAAARLQRPDPPVSDEYADA